MVRLHGEKKSDTVAIGSEMIARLSVFCWGVDSRSLSAIHGLNSRIANP